MGNALKTLQLEQIHRLWELKFEIHSGEFRSGLNKTDSSKDCRTETNRFYFPPLSMFPVLENKNVLFSIDDVCACEDDGDASETMEQNMND